MQYVIKTIHTSDGLEIRASHQNKLHPQNEDNLFTHSTPRGDAAVVASKGLLSGNIPTSSDQGLLCKICKVAATPNYQLFLKSKKIISLLAYAVTPRNHCLNFSSKEILPGDKLPSMVSISRQGHWASYLLNLTSSLLRNFKPCLSKVAQKWLTSKRLYLPLVTPHSAFHRALFLLSSIKASLRLKETQASFRPD